VITAPAITLALLSLAAPSTEPLLPTSFAVDVSTYLAGARLPGGDFLFVTHTRSDAYPHDREYQAVRFRPDGQRRGSRKVCGGDELPPIGTRFRGILPTPDGGALLTGRVLVKLDARDQRVWMSKVEAIDGFDGRVRYFVRGGRAVVLQVSVPPRTLTIVTLDLATGNVTSLAQVALGGEEREDDALAPLVVTADARIVAFQGMMAGDLTERLGVTVLDVSGRELERHVLGPIRKELGSVISAVELANRDFLVVTSTGLLLKMGPRFELQSDGRTRIRFDAPLAVLEAPSGNLVVVPALGSGLGPIRVVPSLALALSAQLSLGSLVTGSDSASLLDLWLDADGRRVRGLTTRAAVVSIDLGPDGPAETRTIAELARGARWKNGELHIALPLVMPESISPVSSSPPSQRVQRGALKGLAIGSFGDSLELQPESASLPRWRLDRTLVGRVYAGAEGTLAAALDDEIGIDAFARGDARRHLVLLSPGVPRSVVVPLPRRFTLDRVGHSVADWRLNLTREGGLELVGRETPTWVKLSFYDKKLEPRGQTVLRLPGDDVLARVAVVFDDGSVLLASGRPAGQELKLARYARDGTVLWERRYPDGGRPWAMARSAPDRVLLAGDHDLREIDAGSGELLRQRALPFDTATVTGRALGDGRAVFLRQGRVEGVPTAGAPVGAPVELREDGMNFGYGDAGRIAALADGSFLVADLQLEAFAVRGKHTDDAVYQARLRRVTADGRVDWAVGVGRTLVKLEWLWTESSSNNPTGIPSDMGIVRRRHLGHTQAVHLVPLPDRTVLVALYGSSDEIWKVRLDGTVVWKKPFPVARTVIDGEPPVRLFPLGGDGGFAACVQGPTVELFDASGRHVAKRSTESSALPPPRYLHAAQTAQGEVVLLESGEGEP
jgi:hypothetical protein